MLKSNKSFMKVTKKGTLMNFVKEHYLREDIPCGFLECPSCEKLLTSGDNARVVSVQETKEVWVVDTNVWLHQLDLLEQLLFQKDASSTLKIVVILLENVLEEIKHRQQKTYEKVRAWLISYPRAPFLVFANDHSKATFTEKLPGESDNDKNDRAIRTSALWFQKHLSFVTKKLPVRLISDDYNNRRLALEASLNALSMKEYISTVYEGSLTKEYLDMVYFPSEEVLFRTNIYDEYKEKDILEEGLQRGVYYKGMLMISQYNPQHCFFLNF